MIGRTTASAIKHAPVILSQPAVDIPQGTSCDGTRRMSSQGPLETDTQRHLEDTSDHTIYEQSKWDVAAIPQARSTMKNALDKEKTGARIPPSTRPGTVGNSVAAELRS
jgi:hypothetical protein